MASLQVSTVQGDTVDGVLWRELGVARGGVDLVLAANPGLAGLPPVLPEGTLLTLPLETTATPEVELIQLWS